MKQAMKWFRKQSSKLKIAVIIPVTILLLSIIGYAFILFGGKLVVNEEDLILNAASLIETQDGELIDTLYDEYRIPIEMEQVPQHVKDAFVAIEDQRFYDHAGVDFKSVVRAVLKDIVAMDKVEGASTITQQVAKNLFLYHDKTWMRKTKEVMAAIYLEREFSKDRILELYMNGIYFGHGLYGIEAAAQKYFSKSTNELTITEGALLAGLAQAPNGYSPINHPEKALNRRNVVLQAMDNAGILSTEKRLQEQGKTIGLNVKSDQEKPWFDSYTDLVMKEMTDKHQISVSELKRGGYRIVVNVDEKAQKIAYEQFKNGAYFPGNTDGVEGAYVMMNHSSGEVVAAIGGRNYQLGDLNRVMVNRQPGSTIKPIAVYGPAMMTGDYHPFSMIKDEKITYDGDYTATNIDNNYAGLVSMYDAIVVSKNAPAVWLLDRIGISNAKDFLEKMGISISDNGLAIALGGLQKGITPMQMAQSYTAFANQGDMVEASTIKEIYAPGGELIYQSETLVTEIFTPQVAWNMTEILEHTVTDGTAQTGFYPKALVGKTGTTQHPFANGIKDAWFVGYTPDYVVSTWIGYDISDKDHYLTGGSNYTTELTKSILTELDKQVELTAEFSKPKHVAALPKPITLPEITDVQVDFILGGLSLFKGELTWKGSDDPRVIYRIYQEKIGLDELIGEVEGKTEFIINDISLFRSQNYYVVPYDPLTKMEGQPSRSAELSL